MALNPFRGDMFVENWSYQLSKLRRSEMLILYIGICHNFFTCRSYGAWRFHMLFFYKHIAPIGA